MNILEEYLELIYTKGENPFYKIVEHDLLTSRKNFVVTANPEILMMGTQELEMDQALKNCTYIVPDGIGVAKAVKWKKKIDCKRITGIDLACHTLEFANEHSLSCYLFGAKPEVLKDVVKKIDKKYPAIKIVGFCDGYVTERENVRKSIIELRPDIVLVALGTPAQEKFINSFFDEIEKGLCIGIGGAFDVISGHTKRAPQFFTSHNLEWLYRIATQPSRLRRFWKGNICFMWKLLING